MTETASGEEQAADGGRVRKRHAFYISGYDPKGAAWYHHTYATEAIKQAAVSSYTISVGDRTRAGRHVARWLVRLDDKGESTETIYDFLKWDDIMRRNWPRGDGNLLWLTLRIYARYLGNGTLYKVLKTSWPSFLAGAYPAVFVLSLALKALLWAWLAYFLVRYAGGWAVVGIAAGIGIAWLTIRHGLRWLERLFGTHWLIRIYAFNLIQARRAVPELDERLDEFADLIVAAAQQEEADEILIVAHSTGVQAAVTVLARALARDPQLADHGPEVSFLTLGGSIQMLAWQPEAQWFRDDLARVGAAIQIEWIDITTAQDGATFALSDPLVDTGLADPAQQGERPKLVSTRLFDLLTPQTFAKIRRNWYKVHFQYLMAGERVADYDFFAITAGARTLKARFAHRPSRRGFDRFKLKVFR